MMYFLDLLCNGLFFMVLLIFREKNTLLYSYKISEYPRVLEDELETNKHSTLMVFTKYHERRTTNFWHFFDVTVFLSGPELHSKPFQLITVYQELPRKTLLQFAFFSFLLT